MTELASHASERRPSLPLHPPPLSPRVTAKLPSPQLSFQHVPPAVTPFIQTPSIDDAFEKKELLGEGGYAKVYIAINRKNGERRAIKLMQRNKLSERAKAMVIHEKEVLRRVSHPAIVKLHQCLQTTAEVCFELDLMRTDLFEFMIEYKRNHNTKAMNEDDVALVMEQLLSSVSYLHENDIVHRDIKPENILINSPLEIKLADFGLAKFIDGPATRNTPMGTSYYIAPEIIRSIEMQSGTAHTTTKDSVKAVDVWACGIVIAFMLSGRPPFIGQIRTAAERKALLNNIDKGVIFSHPSWDGVSTEAKDLVAALLEQNTAHRITAAQALKHPFFEHHGSKRFEKIYAHVPPRVNNDAQPVIIIPDDEEREDVGAPNERLVTMTATDRDSNWQTPTTDYSKRTASFNSYKSALHGASISPPLRPSVEFQPGTVSPPVELALGNGSFNIKDDEYTSLKKELNAMHDEILKAGDSQEELDNYATSSPESGSEPTSKESSTIKQSKKVRLPGVKRTAQ